MEIESGFHDQLNDLVRIDRIEEIDSSLGVAMMTFFRRLGLGHLYPERIVPTMEAGGSRIYLAARDRPWPPWGLGARTIAALCQVHPVGRNSYAVSPVYTGDEDATNIGLIAAVYKEALEDLGRTRGTELNYLVVQGSRFADRLLRGAGFSPTDDLQVTDQARYRCYRVEAAELAKALGLDRISVPELLAHQLDDSTLDRLSGYFAGLHLATGQGRFTDRVVHEILWIDGGLFDADRAALSPPDASPPGDFAGRPAFAPPDAFPPGSLDALRMAPPDGPGFAPPGDIPGRARIAPPGDVPDWGVAPPGGPPDGEGLAVPAPPPDDLRFAPPGDIPGRAGIAPPGDVPDWGVAPPGGPPDDLRMAPPGTPPDDLRMAPPGTPPDDLRMAPPGTPPDELTQPGEPPASE